MRCLRAEPGEERATSLFDGRTRMLHIARAQVTAHVLNAAAGFVDSQNPERLVSPSKYCSVCQGGDKGPKLLAIVTHAKQGPSSHQFNNEGALWSPENLSCFRRHILVAEPATGDAARRGGDCSCCPCTAPAWRCGVSGCGRSKRRL